MEALLPFAALIGASGAFLLASRNKRNEGYKPLINPTVSTSFDQSITNYIHSAASKFNPISNLMDPQANVLLPPDYSEDDLNTTQTDLQANALGTVAVDPHNPSFRSRFKPRTDVLFDNNSSGTKVSIQKCESIQTVDCNAFDDSNFAMNCGMCHETGKNSKGDAISGGGLFVTQDDKTAALGYQKRSGLFRTQYKPTVGSCKKDRFTTTKKECIRLKNQMGCEQSQSFDIPGCSQCYGTESFVYVDEDTPTGTVSLTIAGSGNASILKMGDPISNTTQIKLSKGSKVIPLPSFQEGDIISISVYGDNCSIYGYLSGVTPTGSFALDIVRIVEKDIVSGTKPLVSGYASLDTISVSKMVPARGRDTMELVVLNPFTFLTPDQPEALQCTSFPFLTKKDSANFLSSGVCYKKNTDGTKQRPGNYSMECLQGLFTSSGCTANGTAFPTNSSSATSLMTGSDGSSLELSKISETIYTNSQLAYTGLDQLGNKVDISEWNKASKWCTGKTITSPCSIEGDGPHSGECLSYLWLNKGASDNVEGGEGPTYTTPNLITSMQSDSKNQYCTPNGTMSPINPNGSINQSVVNSWNGLGRTDLTWVKGNMDKFHRMANDNTMTDEERAPWIKYCYGIDFANSSASQSELAGGSQSIGNIVSTLDNKPGRTKTPFTPLFTGNKSQQYFATITSNGVVSPLNFGINQNGGDPNWANMAMYTLQPYFNTVYVTPTMNITAKFYNLVGTITVSQGFTVYGYININGSPSGMTLDPQSFTGTSTINKPLWYFLLIVPSFFPPPPALIPNPGSSYFPNNLYRGTFNDDPETILSRLSELNI